MNGPHLEPIKMRFFFLTLRFNVFKMYELSNLIRIKAALTYLIIQESEGTGLRLSLCISARQSGKTECKTVKKGFLGDH